MYHWLSHPEAIPARRSCAVAQILESAQKTSRQRTLDDDIRRDLEEFGNLIYVYVYVDVYVDVYVYVYAYVDVDVYVDVYVDVDVDVDVYVDVYINMYMACIYIYI